MKKILLLPAILCLKFPQDILKFLLIFLAIDGILTLFYLFRKRKKRISRGENRRASSSAAKDGADCFEGELHVDNTFEMTGGEFEEFVAELYRRLGYKIISAKKSRDQGIDLVVRRVFRTGIQCKCYHRPVGNKAIQEAAAGKKYYGLRRAAVVTNSIFTASAADLAKKTKIKLIDRRKLAELIRRTR